jgi:hypothetical protein
MQRPKHIPGYCPHFYESLLCCYLTEQVQSNRQIEYHCKSEQHCKTCGNYEAWKRGSNYKNK